MELIQARPIPLRDRFDRRIDYLRVSVTDRCNFRCIYCMPEEGLPATPSTDVLRFEEFVRLAQIAASVGISKIRLTGGEPLLRKDLVSLVHGISAIPGIEDLSCTTNGFLLEEKADDLKKAGLHRVNVSLDTLNPQTFTDIARRGSLDKVMRGIDAATKAGLAPIKINCVLMRMNLDEVGAFAEWTLRQPVNIRFIELMPMRWNLDESAPAFDNFTPHGGRGLLEIKQCAGGMLDDVQMRRQFVPSSEAIKRIENAYGSLEDAEVQTNGPARSYRIPGAVGTLGFISQISNDFCSRCNRLRLTHDGFLRPCLMSDGELDLRTALREGGSDEDLRALFIHAVDHKPERHYLAEGQVVAGRSMSQIGG